MMRWREWVTFLAGWSVCAVVGLGLAGFLWSMGQYIYVVLQPYPGH